MSPVRIDGNARIGNLAGRAGVGQSASGVPIEVGQGPTTTTARPAASVAATTSLGALLALQAVEDPLLKRKKLVRRGLNLLDTLEDIRADLLAGQLGEGRLNQLVAVIGQAREGSEPGLDALLDDIELRARVELAKRGLFPAG